MAERFHRHCNTITASTSLPVVAPARGNMIGAAASGVQENYNVEGEHNFVLK
jgi:hypothetical protein